MNINKSYLAFAVAGAMLLASCEPDKSLPNKMSVGLNTAYFGEAVTGNTLRFEVGDDGGSTMVTPRISNPTDGTVTMDVAVDADLLAEYNRVNNSNFKLLPEANYDLVLGGQSGKDLKIDLTAGDYGRAIQVRVKNMFDADGNALPIGTSYVIPLRLKSVSGSGVEYKNDRNTLMVFMDRKFSTPVLHKTSASWTIAAKTDGTNIQAKEWSFQYSFSLDRLTSNIGLGWPEGGGMYTRAESSGGGAVNVNGATYGFNQPKFEDFRYEVNKWYHVTYTYKVLASGTPQVRIYINGDLALESNWPRAIEDFRFWAVGNGNFSGLIREVRFWSRELNASEVQATMYSADPEAPGLEFYFPLNRQYGPRSIVPGKEDLYQYKFGNSDSSTPATLADMDLNTIVNFPN